MGKLFFMIVLQIVALQSKAMMISLEDEFSDSKIILSSYPDRNDLYIVSWEKFDAITPKNGTMVYRIEKSTSGVTYFAVGDGGYFSIVERGAKTLVNGTVKSVYSVIAADPNHPIPMKASKETAHTSQDLLDRYYQYANVGKSDEKQEIIQNTIDSSLLEANKSCNSKMALKIKWDSFGPKQMRFAKQAKSVLDGVLSVCHDKDYKEAIGKMAQINVQYSTAGPLKISKDAKNLAVSLSSESFNVKESVAKWLQVNL